MNIKKTITGILVSAATFVLASCGVQIQMENAEPAQTNLGRGTMIRFARPGNKISRKLCHAIANRIIQDGYYTIHSGNTGGRMVFLEIMNAKLKTTTSSNSSYTDLIATIRIRDYVDRELYRTRIKERVDEDSYDNLYVDDACRAIALTVMQDLTPHSVTYKEKVSPDDDNPSLELAAKACAAGNWEQGKQYAQQAITARPDDPEAYYLMGLIERNALNYAQSTAYFEKADSIDSESKYKAAIIKNATLATKDEHVRQQLSN